MSKITESKTFCPHAWLSATHTNGGYYKPCCRFTRMGEDNHWGLTEQENIQQLNQIRKEMIEGKSPAHCLNCWREESKDLDSLRTLALKQEWWHPYRDQINATAQDGATDIKPIYFDLKLGNRCNLGCVMCHAGDSSVIEQELRNNINDISDKQRAELDWLDANPLTDADIDKLFDRLENNSEILSIKFTGGEPFVNPRITDFLDTCLSKGLQKKVTIFFTTNLIALTPKIINKLKNFPKCHITVSMEGVDTIYEYMRYPASWKKFESNWKKLQKTDIAHDVVFTISALNVPYMPWWMAWVKEQGVHWMPNVVWDPVHLSLPEMPQDLKNQTIQDLLDARHQWPEDARFLDGIINTIGQPSVSGGKAWDKTIEQIEFQDRIRGRSIEKFLPGMIQHVS